MFFLVNIVARSYIPTFLTWISFNNFKTIPDLNQSLVLLSCFAGDDFRYFQLGVSYDKENRQKPVVDVD